MAQTVKLKRSAVASKAPTTSDVALGELAINTHDGRVYLKKDNGAASIVKLADPSDKLSAFAATTSAELAGVISDETGSGALVFANSPTLVTPALGTPASGTLTNCTFPTLNQNTTGSAASLSVSGQTGLLTVTGLTSTNRVKTVRDAADTVLELGGSYTPSGTWVWTSATVTWPTFNQDTTGSAVYWKTSGTGKGAISGPATGTTRTYTFPDADATVLYSGGALGTPSSGTVTNLTGTASININGTVGATTPASGAFTTLSASGVVTVSAGTASAPAITTSGDTNTGFWFPAADTIAASTAGSERMRIDSSGNIGIGDAAGAYGFPIIIKKADGSLVRAGGASYALTINSDAGAGVRLEAADSTGSTSYQPLITSGSIQIFRSGGNERMRIDSSGDIILGAGEASGTTTGATLRGPARTGSNAAGVDTTISAANGTGTGGSGNIIFKTAPVAASSSTANTLTEVMRLAPTGYVSIGNVTPTQALTVNGAVGWNAPVSVSGSTHTVAVTTNWVIVNYSAGTCTVTLPAAASFTGRILTISTVNAKTVISASSNVVPITGGSAGTAILAATAGKFATMVSDGTNWVIMQAN